MSKKYEKDVVRKFPFSIIKAWHEGDKGLKRWIDFGFFNTIFVSESGWVTTYYDSEECDTFQEILKEKLNENLFDDLCDDFFELIGKAKTIDSEEECFELYIKMFPAFIIFDELSKYPELGNDYMIRRLIRVRQTVQDFSFIENKLNQSGPKDYIFYKGEIYEIPLEQFLKENDIEIIK